MSDILQEAEDLMKERDLVSRDDFERIVPRLMAEIKRLREEEIKANERYIELQYICDDNDKQLAAMDAQNNDLMANCNQLRDRCWKAEGEFARLQKIAIDERVKAIVLIEKLKDVANNPDWQTRGLSKTLEEYEKQAAEELQLEAAKEAGYVERLEKAYVVTKSINILETIDREELNNHYRNAELPWMAAQEKGKRIVAEAQAALAKIREMV